jgi:hypothetical protein
MTQANPGIKQNSKRYLAAKYSQTSDSDEGCSSAITAERPKLVMAAVRMPPNGSTEGSGRRAAPSSRAGQGPNDGAMLYQEKKPWQ